MKQAQADMMQAAQNQQDFWAGFAEHFKDTPLYESFQELWKERGTLWENLEELASWTSLKELHDKKSGNV